jgi:hypothetical protein
VFQFVSLPLLLLLLLLHHHEKPLQTTSEDTNNFWGAMYRLLSLVGISSVVAASAIQQPLHEPASQTPINTKELVSSTTLEAHITQKNLLERAKHLFKIAELGAEEYNHPTRVIGSKGRSQFHF